MDIHSLLQILCIEQHPVAVYVTRELITRGQNPKV